MTHAGNRLTDLLFCYVLDHLVKQLQQSNKEYSGSGAEGPRSPRRVLLGNQQDLELRVPVEDENDLPERCSRQSTDHVDCQHRCFYIVITSIK